MNNVVLIGRLTRDPELRYIPNSGAAVTNFTLAVDKQLAKDKKDEMEAKNQPTADFIRIVVWGKMAENCANYLSRGRLVAVQGRIQTGSYDAQDGSKRYTFDVVANNVEFLEWGDKNSGNQQSGSTGGSDDFSDLDGLYQPVGNDDIPF